MQPGIERLPRPYEDVRRGAQSPQHPVGTLRKLVGRHVEMGNDDHEVIVAVRSGITAGPGTEQVDAIGAQEVDQAPDDLIEDRVFRRDKAAHEETVSRECRVAVTGDLLVRDLSLLFRSQFDAEDFV